VNGPGPFSVSTSPAAFTAVINVLKPPAATAISTISSVIFHLLIKTFKLLYIMLAYANQVNYEKLCIKGDVIVIVQAQVADSVQ
jgi:hypothetical protein